MTEEQRISYVSYRLEKSMEALKDAKLLAENGAWNACVNRLYYSCFYIVSALLLKNNISANTHTGLINQFNLHFIKTGIVEKRLGKFYAKLLDWRQSGDYGDAFDFDQEKVEPLLFPVEEFVNTLAMLVNNDTGIAKL